MIRSAFVPVFTAITFLMSPILSSSLQINLTFFPNRSLQVIAIILVIVVVVVYDDPLVDVVAVVIGSVSPPLENIMINSTVALSSGRKFYAMRAARISNLAPQIARLHCAE